MRAADLVQQQLEAYNAHDLEKFLAVYSETVETFRMPSTEPAISGKAQLREFYATNRFNVPQLHAELLSRMVMGNKVVDHERVTGLRDAAFEVVCIYEVMGGLIQRVWFFAAE
jgi:hypothetical protein